MMKKKMIAAISALCMAGTVYASVGNVVNAESVRSELTAETTASQDRIYCIASVSKMYSTLAVMQLVDEGKVELDAPVTKYLSDFKMKDEQYKDITVRMLMNHTSGISSGLTTNDYLYNDVDSFLHDNTLDIVSRVRFKAAPGEYACYNNVGFMLMEHIVENVSGMSYTDYVRNNIASKIGADHTGTAWSLYSGDMGDTQVSLYRGSLPIEYPYEMAAGTGGIYATASDVANFGSVFFTGNDVLLSDDAKTQMSTRWNDDTKYESYGLGWDFVEQVRYEKENIKVMGKGGDVPHMHSCLLVAPDEQISTAVLTAGNDSSSQYAGLMASALMDVVLEERGKAVGELTPPEPKITDTIPDHYKKYEGLYCIGGLYSDGICRITFDNTVMYKEDLCTDRSSPERYRYTEDGGFVKVNDSGKMTSDREIVYFEEKDGGIYIRTDKFTVYPGLGNTSESMYTGEKMDENPVSHSVQQSWDDLSQTLFVIYNEKWTSQHYESPFYRVVTDEEFPGYIMVKNSAGARAEKLTDEDHAGFFTSIPSTANRDLYDIEITEQTYADKTSAASLDLSDGTRCRSVDSLPEFTADTTEIPLHSSEAAWYRIGKDMSGKSIVVERPDNSAVFVYNKFRELLYSTHIKDAMNTIDLPPDGYIAFAGETGDSVKIFK
ncbi:MAG: beta-lactamase family protein [Lachnospiraceae bacterium]|nr:beta-lactamase family protein [Lachnospiraceae bacterium]